MVEDASQIRAFSCQYCEGRFKRLEHLQRHERSTHTKSTPYKCHCGKGYPRGDLLRRHEKSAHQTETGKRRRTDGDLPGMQQVGESRTLEQSQSYPESSPTWQQSHASLAAPNVSRTLDLQGILSRSPNSSDGLAGDASGKSGSQHQPSSCLGWQEQADLGSTNQSLSTGVLNMFDFNTTSFDNALDPFDIFGDASTVFANVDFSSLFLPYEFGLDQQIPAEKANCSEGKAGNQRTTTLQSGRTLAPDDTNEDVNTISRLGSPLPSIRPQAELHTTQSREIGRTRRSVPCWKISKSEYVNLEQNIAALSTVLNDFTLPSRHSVSRYLEGCIKGLLEHMPNLHIPTWSAVNATPDLLLAMCAIGAQFRFEGNAAHSLFYAAKAAVLFQLQYNQYKTEASARCIASSQFVGQDFESASRDAESSHQRDEKANHARYDPLQTMQAILCLMVQGSWGARQLVSEAIGFQSLVADLARQDGLGPEPASASDIPPTGDSRAKWLQWIRSESLRRTKLMAYTFINLQSAAYNVPPCLLTSEVQLNSPAAQSEWNARAPEAWLQAHQASKLSRTVFAEAVRSLFQGPDSAFTEPSSAIENYALIFAILQRIFLLREAGVTSIHSRDTNSLGAENIESLSRALRNWQTRWEASPESNIEPQSASGPVAFNSTALLRLAWIRLYSDLGPCRSLATRDSSLIVEAFQRCPTLVRTPKLTPALLHAAHALSIPVRLGIDYVAKTQTLSWSVQHSLCNLECAIFLSKWFEAVASTVATTPLTNQEIGLVSMIRGIILETGFFREEAFEPAIDVQGWQKLIQHLGTAVAALWGQVFSGAHVFDLVSTIGTSLNTYAKLLGDAHTPIDGYL